MNTRRISFIIALTLVLPLLFSGPVSAEEENIPTIFVNNEAWYKNSLLPLIAEDGDYLVPISVFSSFDHLEVEYEEVYKCYIIESENGAFVSVSAEKGRYLDQNDECGDIKTYLGKSEPYISVWKIAELLGLGIEHAVFYDKDVLRLYYEEELQPLEILIDYYITAIDSFIGTAGIGGTAIRRKTFSFFTDISKMNSTDIRNLLNATSEQGISMTFAIPCGFASEKKNQSILFEIVASGHTFAVSIDGSSDKSPLEQISECNAELYTLLKKKTLLVISSSAKNELKANGYIVLNDSFRISGLNSASDVNFNINDIIYFDKITSENILKFNNIISEAKANGRTVTAISALAGN